MVTPDLNEFLARARRGNLIPVYREILADRLTPVSAYERLTAAPDVSDGNGYAFLLESVEGGERIGRYSFLGSNPALVLRTRRRQATLLEGDAVRQIGIPEGQDPLSLLKQLLERYQYVEDPALPRFCGGAVGFFSYDVVRFFEDLPDNNPDELGVDDACFLFTDTLLIFDHVRHRIKVLCNAHVVDDAGAAYEEALRKIEALVARLRVPYAPPPLPSRPPPRDQTVQVEHCFPHAEYESRCRTLPRIHSGRRCLSNRAFPTLQGRIHRHSLRCLPRPPLCQPFSLYVLSGPG